MNPDKIRALFDELLEEYASTREVEIKEFSSNVTEDLATIPGEVAEYKRRLEEILTEQRTDDLDELNISTRARRALRSAGITTIKRVSEKTSRQLLGLKDFGVKAYRETEMELKARGLSLVDDISVKSR
jgi:DNA-directed RNA polymerase alpha subunit